MNWSHLLNTRCKFLANIGFLTLAVQLACIVHPANAQIAKQKKPAASLLPVTEMTVEELNERGQKLVGRRVAVRNCTITEADDIYLLCSPAEETCESVFVDVKTLVNKDDARRAFVNCKEQTLLAQCRARVEGVVALTENENIEIMQASLTWQGTTPLPLPQAPAGTVDIHDFLLDRENYYDKPVAISGCQIEAYGGNSLRCKLREKTAKWQSREERRAEQIIIYPDKGARAEFRRAFFLCRQKNVRLPECEATLSGVPEESRLGFLRMNKASIRWATEAAPVSVPPPKIESSLTVQEALIDAVEQPGKKINITNCLIERARNEKLNCRPKESPLGSGWFEFSLSNPDRTDVRRILDHCRETAPSTDKKKADETAALCAAQVIGVVEPLRGRDFSLKNAKIAWTAPLPEAQGSEEGKYRVEELKPLKEKLQGKTITITDCNLLQFPIMTLQCRTRGGWLGSQIQIIAKLPVDDRARLFDYCRDLHSKTPPAECAAEITGKVYVPSGLFSSSKPDDTIRIIEATVNWREPAQRKTPPAGDSAYLTIPQLLIEATDRTGQNVKIAECQLQLNITSGIPFCAWSAPRAQAEAAGAPISNPITPLDGAIALADENWSDDDIRWMSRHCVSDRKRECLIDIGGTVATDGKAVILLKPSVLQWYHRSELPPLDPQNIAAIDLLLSEEKFNGAQVTLNDCVLGQDEDGEIACQVVLGKEQVSGIEIKARELPDAVKKRIAAQCKLDEQSQGGCPVTLSGKVRTTPDSIFLENVTVTWK